jgi:hypothetical protein
MVSNDVANRQPISGIRRVPPPSPCSRASSACLSTLPLMSVQLSDIHDAPNEPGRLAKIHSSKHRQLLEHRQMTRAYVLCFESTNRRSYCPAPDWVKPTFSKYRVNVLVRAIPVITVMFLSVKYGALES